VKDPDHAQVDGIPGVQLIGVEKALLGKRRKGGKSHGKPGLM